MNSLHYEFTSFPLVKTTKSVRSRKWKAECCLGGFMRSCSAQKAQLSARRVHVCETNNNRKVAGVRR